MPLTQKEIARLAGVNQTTVSRALRNHPQITLKTRQHIQSLAKKLGYRKNAFASFLIQQRHNKEEKPYHATLALLCGHKKYNPLHRHIPYSLTFKGAQQRGAELGYKIEQFWVHKPGFSDQRLHSILQARSIPGLMLLYFDPSEINLDWNQYSVIFAGRNRLPAPFNLVTFDYYEITLETLQRVFAMGYRRIGMYIAEQLNQNFNQRFEAAYHLFQQQLDPKHRIPLFKYGKKTKTMASEKKQTMNWLHRHQPEVILQQGPHVQDWLHETKPNHSQDIKYIHLEIRKKNDPATGFYIPYEQQGATAVDMLVGQLHRNEKGTPKKTHIVYLEAEWNQGKTVPSSKFSK